MLVKGIILFLAVMAVLAMFGRLRFQRRRGARLACRTCGRPRIGKGPCTCGQGRA